MKTEPEEFSWDDAIKRGAKGEPWTGVRNFTARRHMKEMKKGDQAFFYHTGDEKQIVGVVEVIRESYPDPTDADGKFLAVDVKAIEPLPKPGTLAAVKADALSEPGPRRRGQSRRHGVWVRAFAGTTRGEAFGQTNKRGEASMTFAGLNYLAIVIAAVVAWLAGAVWYMSLGKIWTAAQGLTVEEMHARRSKPGAHPVHLLLRGGAGHGLGAGRAGGAPRRRTG